MISSPYVLTTRAVRFKQTLMPEDFPHKEEIIDAISGTEPRIKKIFLFGSRARGDNRSPHSDIDIGVIATKKLSLLRLAKIEEALDRIQTLHTIELVDFTRREDAFTKEALKDIVILYEKR